MKEYGFLSGWDDVNKFSAGFVIRDPM